MEYKNIKGVPNFECIEISERKTKYCLCIPIINEGERILAELQKACDYDIHKLIDIVICDGGSTDGSNDKAILEKYGVNTILIKKGEGKQGAQLRMGFWWALNRGYKGVITIDGNNKDSIEDVPKFIECLDNGYDFVQGSRFIKGGYEENTPFIRNISVRLIHAPIISLTAGKWYTDTTNAYRAHSRRYLASKQVDIFRDIFMTYELLAYLSVRADQLGLNTCEIPVKRIYPKGKVPTKISKFKGNYLLMKILILNLFGKYNPKTKVKSK